MIPLLRNRILMRQIPFCFLGRICRVEIACSRTGETPSSPLNGVTVAFRPINKMMLKDGPPLKLCIPSPLAYPDKTSLT